MLDPSTNIWTQIFPMRSCRSGLGVAAYRGHIYAVGGTISESSSMSIVETYNPQTHRWSPVMSMHSPRSYFGIKMVDDQLFVVGGHDGFSPMPAVERYSEDTRMWYGASNTEIACSSLSCCVLHGLHNVVENLFLRDPVTPPNADENQS